MTTIADLVNQIERDLLVHHARPVYDKPSGSYGDSTTSVSLATTTRLAAGAMLDANLELMYVAGWNEGTQTATVIRGFLGTTAAAGDSTTLVRINPRFPTPSIVDTCLDEIRSWDGRLFATEEATVAFPDGYTTVELTPVGTPLRILAARPRAVNADDVHTYVGMELRTNDPVYSSGYSVQVDYPFSIDVTVDVVLAVTINTAAITAATNLEGLGLTAGMLEIVKWGALSRLVAGKEALRLDPTVHARPDLDQAVPASALLQAGAQYGLLRNQAYDREVRRLLAAWPVRFYR